MDRKFIKVNESNKKMKIKPKDEINATIIVENKSAVD